jgi:hypothetical protein
MAALLAHTQIHSSRRLSHHDKYRPLPLSLEGSRKQPQKAPAHASGRQLCEPKGHVKYIKKCNAGDGLLGNLKRSRVEQGNDLQVGFESS